MKDNPHKDLIKRLKYGCVYEAKRWSGDPARVDEGATDTRMREAAEALEKAYAAKPPAVRRFRHIRGFQDATEYFEWDGEQMFIKSRGGHLRFTELYALDDAIRYVRQGAWEEITDPSSDESAVLRTWRMLGPATGAWVYFGWDGEAMWHLAGTAKQSRIRVAFTLEEAAKFVAEGRWEEIE